jgi:predicted DNA-binding protein
MKQISIRLADREFEHLQKFSELSERNQSDVLRELIRNLSFGEELKPLKP